MDTHSSYAFIQIGLTIRILRNVGKNESAIATKENIESLSELLNEVGFEASLAYINEGDALLEFDEKFASATEDTVLGNQASELIDIFTRLEAVVFAEGMTKNIYAMPVRRYTAEYLLKNPAKLLGPGTFASLSDLAKYDFSASCRCIMYGEGTAAAFHIIRATEDTLKQYYHFYKKRDRNPKPMWGTMISELRAKKSNKPSSDLLLALDHMRSRYRNPTQHPEMRYDIEAAQDLFGSCVIVLNEMTAAIDSGL